MTDIEETGAIDWFLIEARGKQMNGALVPPLLDLVDRRLIRIIDVLVLVKRGEGDFDALTTSISTRPRSATSAPSPVPRRGCCPPRTPRPRPR